MLRFMVFTKFLRDRNFLVQEIQTWKNSIFVKEYFWRFTVFSSIKAYRKIVKKISRNNSSILDFQEKIPNKISFPKQLPKFWNCSKFLTIVSNNLEIFQEIWNVISKISFFNNNQKFEHFNLNFRIFQFKYSQ